ncbi:WD repeat-containing protein on Y chromosome-like [Octopus sinensis]|uniref:WD repeat-containing protein on Y chromosome-like n=1 Tax=Octopus sinensis TaxID=2607531 RepID=A0A7E6FTJ0_9MOLL|nr:WD repeat-containing protein on Y chromosome-like [Octopus sinensis]
MLEDSPKSIEKAEAEKLVELFKDLPECENVLNELFGRSNIPKNEAFECGEAVAVTGRGERGGVGVEERVGGGGGGRGSSSGFTGKLETRLHITDLELLQDIFMIEQEGTYTCINLTKEQFCDSLTSLLNKGTRQEYAELFEKIDVTCEGFVNWDKLGSHMLHEFYEREDRVKASQIPQWKDLKVLSSPHKETIQRVTYLKNSHKYLVISKEGIASIWNSNLQQQRCEKLTTESCRSKDLWVTHFTPMLNTNKMAVAYTSKEIAIYDLSNKIEFNRLYKIKELKYTPLCLDYWSSNDSSNEAYLVWGDVGGFVNILHFNSINIALFQRPSAHSESEICLTVPLSNVTKGIYRNVTYTKYQAHTDWVKQVGYLQFLDCFISCSTSWKDALVLGWMEKHVVTSEILSKSEKRQEARKIQKMVNFQIPQGINNFHYSPQFNLIATAGVNHKICLWNPYVKSKPNGILQGHMSSVVVVHIWSSRSLLFSFSKDKALRIWDIQLQVCVQRLVGMFPKVGDVFISLFLDEVTDHKEASNTGSSTNNSTSSSSSSSSSSSNRESNRLFLTFGPIFTVIEMKNECRNRVVSHETVVVAVAYSPSYNQVVSLSQDGTLTFWMLDSGQKVKHLSNIHEKAEMLSLALDPNTNKLYTSSTDGCVKVWDFNGHCCHKLICAGGQEAEIGQVSVLKGSVAAVGWKRSITVFRNVEMKDFIVNPSEWKGLESHEDDILCMAFSPPCTLVTGAYNGEIIMWNTKSELATGYMRQRCRPQLSQSFRSATSGTVRSSAGARNSGRKTGSSRNRSRISSCRSEDYYDEQNEFGWTVVNVHLLDSRKCLDVNCANLVSCGGNGWVRFWNTDQCLLMAEFVAHKQAGSITMTVGSMDTYLITGDIQGWIKVWDISDYATDLSPSTLDIPPPLLTTFQPHTDMVNSLRLCERNQCPFIVSASSDSTVVISHINGQQIGVFGQEGHWKLDPCVRIEPETKMSSFPQDKEEDDDNEDEEDEEEEEEEDGKEEIAMSNLEQGEEEEAIANPEMFRWNTWEKTILGKDYQEVRVKKRRRRQPGKLTNCQLTWEKAGPYSESTLEFYVGTTFQVLEVVDVVACSTSPISTFFY